MLRWLACLCLSALLLSGCASLNFSDPTQLLQAPVAEAASVASTACAVTQPFVDQPPDDPNADAFPYGNWHINGDRTLWVYIPPTGVWHTEGEKVIWIRPAGTELAIRGQRLDAEATLLVATIPCCYPTGFQVTGLNFPTEGCWEVSATAGNDELSFIIEVKNSPPQAEGQPARLGIDPASPLATSVLLQFCNVSVCELRLHDTATGVATSGFAPLTLGPYATFGPSNDLTQLALITFQNNTTLQDGRLSFVDLATWENVPTSLTFDGAYDTPFFSPDDTRLVVLSQEGAWPATVNKVHLVDVASGTILAEQPLDFFPNNYRFTADGTNIMLYGMFYNASDTNSDTAHVALLDATSLEVVWQAHVEGLISGLVMPEGGANPHDGMMWQPATAFALDSATLYIVHANEDQLTSVDFAAQKISTRALTAPLSWIERLLMLTATTAHAKMMNGVTKQAALSPDGSQLYVIGTRHSVEEGMKFVQTGLGLQVIDLATGKVRAHINTEAQSLTVDPLSGRIFLHGWSSDPAKPFTTEWTEVLDATTLEEVTRINHKAIAVARRLDGTPILLATTMLANEQTELAVLDPHTFAVLSTSADWYRGHVGWVVMR